MGCLDASKDCARSTPTGLGVGGFQCVLRPRFVAGSYEGGGLCGIEKPLVNAARRSYDIMRRYCNPFRRLYMLTFINCRYVLVAARVGQCGPLCHRALKDLYPEYHTSMRSDSMISMTNSCAVMQVSLESRYGTRKNRRFSMQKEGCWVQRCRADLSPISC